MPWSPTGVSRCSPKCSIWPSYGVCGQNILIRSAISRNTRRFAASAICLPTSLLDWVTRWLESAEEGSEGLFALAAIRLLIFTGARFGEMLTLRWDYVDLGQRALKLPESKTGA